MNIDGDKNDLKFHLSSGNVFERLQTSEKKKKKSPKLAINTKAIIDSFHLSLPGSNEVTITYNHHCLRSDFNSCP